MGPDCASSVCASCQPVGGYTFSSCCSQASPSACFVSNFDTTASVTDSNSISCVSALNLVESCNGQTSHFTNLPISQQASCLCYSGSTWIPDVFDGLYDHCFSYFKTEDPSEYSTITGNGGLCSSAGNVLSATASANPTVGTSSTLQSSTSKPVAVATSTIPTATSASPTSSGTAGKNVNQVSTLRSG